MAQNKFGGKWTLKKVEIFMNYLPKYLTIFHSRITKKGENWKLIYFDAFAGSGAVLKENEQELIESVAVKVLEIELPRRFDMYYLVEKDTKKAYTLKQKLHKEYSTIKNQIYIADSDANEKIEGLANYMRKNRNYAALAFIDPFGLQVEWKIIKNLKGLHLDMWILLPTGIGIGRLLKKDGKIEESWLSKIEYSLGLSKEEIEKEFYQKSEQVPLFQSEESDLVKKRNAINKIVEMYKLKLKEIFNEVSEPFVMKNSKNSPMYHFIFCSNNSSAVKIANYIVKKMNYRID